MVGDVNEWLAKADAMIQIAKEKSKSKQDEYWVRIFYLHTPLCNKDGTPF